VCVFVIRALIVGGGSQTTCITAIDGLPPPEPDHAPPRPDDLRPPAQDDQCQRALVVLVLR
jgi:hypothetical protein